MPIKANHAALPVQSCSSRVLLGTHRQLQKAAEQGAPPAGCTTDTMFCRLAFSQGATVALPSAHGIGRRAHTTPAVQARHGRVHKQPITRSFNVQLLVCPKRNPDTHTGVAQARHDSEQQQYDAGAEATAVTAEPTAGAAAYAHKTPQPQASSNNTAR